MWATQSRGSNNFPSAAQLSTAKRRTESWSETEKCYTHLYLAAWKRQLKLQKKKYTNFHKEIHQAKILEYKSENE